MDSSKLEKFATAARVALLDQMAGLVTQALSDPKIAAEYPNDVAALRAAVAEHGETWVADTAAHTWFNRLTAVRFMDVRGFSGLYRVVSPAEGSASNLPEILLRAQSGEFGDEIPDRTRSEVSALLSGRRTSANAQLEAYALLLRAMFVAWYPSMPEVFTGPADWIRLLVPADLLAPTSVRERAVAVMDEDACETVEVVGWLYQFYNSDLKDEINKAKVPIDAAELPAVTQLFTPHWIVRYLVENSLGRLWLRSRPTSGLREHMPYFVEPIERQPDTGVTVESPEEIRVVDPACGSGHMLTYAFDLLFHIYEEAGYARTEIPQKILTHNLRGLEIDSRAAQLASFALAMKARDKDRRFLTRKVDGSPVRPDIVRIEPLAFDGDDVELLARGLDRDDRSALEALLQSFVHADTFGSLIRVDPINLTVLDRVLSSSDPAVEIDTQTEARTEVASRVAKLKVQAEALCDDQYHVVVANPPYLGSGKMGALLRSFVRNYYPDSSVDLYACFIERCIGLTCDSAMSGLVVMRSWMTSRYFSKFRRHVARERFLYSLFDLESGVMGIEFPTVAAVWAKGFYPSRETGLLRVANGSDVGLRVREILGRETRLAWINMTRLPRPANGELLPWLDSSLLSAFAELSPLSEYIETREGLTTGDNDRFLREWHEVSLTSISQSEENSSLPHSWEKRWYPYQKGGESRRWYANAGVVVDWQFDGYSQRQNVAADGRIRSHNYNGEYAFREGLTWTGLSSGSFAVRWVPSGFMFDTKGPMGFAVDSKMLTLLIGLLNSAVVAIIIRELAPSMDFKLGHILAIPTPSIDPTTSSIPGFVEELIRLCKADSDAFESSVRFQSCLAELGAELAVSSEQRWVSGISDADRSVFLERKLNSAVAELFDAADLMQHSRDRSTISLTRNPFFRYAPNGGANRSEEEYRTKFDLDLARELLSYAVGCIMGRYSLDHPGLMLADAGSTLADFEAKVPNARFRPDEDGIIPITATAYFDDDIVSRVREFLSVAFGEENLTANVSWIEHALGSGKRKELRQYFLKDFYADHLKMYSNRPIYWQVSSNSKQPTKGFNSLIYLHRYTPATLGIVRENYANDMLDKQESRLTTIAHALESADEAEATELRKEQDALTQMQREIQDWVTTTLFPVSTAEIELDLDDGVKQNYPKLGAVLKYVKGLS